LEILIRTPPPVTPAAKPSAAPDTVWAVALTANAATAAEAAENFMLSKDDKATRARGLVCMQKTEAGLSSNTWFYKSSRQHGESLYSIVMHGAILSTENIR
jgi:hypothetical protein